MSAPGPAVPARPRGLRPPHSAPRLPRPGPSRRPPAEARPGAGRRGGAGWGRGGRGGRTGAARVPRSRPGGSPRRGVGRNSRHPLCPRCQHGASRGREPRRGGGGTPRGEAGRTGRAAPPCRDLAGRPRCGRGAARRGTAFGPRSVGSEGSSEFPRRPLRDGGDGAAPAAPPRSSRGRPAALRAALRSRPGAAPPGWDAAVSAPLRGRSEVPARFEARGAPAK